MPIQNIEGHLIATNMKIALVVGRFNEFINNKLLEGAIDLFIRHGGKEEDLTLARVPGALEIPLICQKLAETKKYNGIVALGSVIRGSTTHFEHVSNQVSGGITQVSLKTELPIGMGVLTLESIEQGIERAGTKAGNKGAEAMLATIEMIDLIKKI